MFNYYAQYQVEVAREEIKRRIKAGELTETELLMVKEAWGEEMGRKVQLKHGSGQEDTTGEA